MFFEYSIYETKSHFSRLLKLVKSGKEVIVTDRGEPVVKIVPYTDDSTFEKRIRKMEMSGQIKRAKKKPLFKSSPKSVQGGLERFLDSRR